MSENIDCRSVGERLRVLRTVRRMSLVRVAKALGVSPAAVSMWENGLRNPAKRAEELGKLFKADPSLFRGQENIDFAVLRELGRMDRADKASVLHFARKLAEQRAAVVGELA